VLWQRQGQLAITLTTTSDESGRYCFYHVPAGDYMARIENAVHRLNVPDVRTHRHDFVIRGASVSGTLIDIATGGPVPFGHVTLSPVRAGEQHEPEGGPAVYATAHLLSATSDSRGVFLLENIPAGTYRLLCRAPGYMRTSSDTFTVLAREHKVGVCIRMDPGCTVQGRLLTPDGLTPVSKALIAIWPGQRNTGSETRWVTARTDPGGWFSVSGVPEGPYLMLVAHPAYAPLIIKGKKASRGRSPALVLRMQKGAAVMLKLTDQTGAPLEGATVSLRYPEGPAVYLPDGLHGLRSPLFHSDSQGVVWLTNLPAQPLLVTVSKTGYQPISTSLEPASLRAPVRLTLIRQ
jgi:hypothetical protein